MCILLYHADAFDFVTSVYNNNSRIYQIYEETFQYCNNKLLVCARPSRRCVIPDMQNVCVRVLPVSVYEYCLQFNLLRCDAVRYLLIPTRSYQVYLTSGIPGIVLLNSTIQLIPRIPDTHFTYSYLVRLWRGSLSPVQHQTCRICI